MVAREVVTMRIVGLREPRDHATKLLRERDPALVMRRDKVAGVFLPWTETLLRWSSAASSSGSRPGLGRA